MSSQLSLFESADDAIDETVAYPTSLIPLAKLPLEKQFIYLNQLNDDRGHFMNRDDICTPMQCVKTMLDYIPQDFWQNKNLRILDPCCGNGNFGAYCQTKTNANNIWYNEINPIRISNCRQLLNPKHLRQGDAFNLNGDFSGNWDLIMANPPYSGGGNKNRGIASLFIENAINQLSDKGYLCFITPNNWMTYNNNNTTLKMLLHQGSFLVIDNTAKKYFKGVGSSFTIFVWQKGILDHKTTVYNNYLLSDTQYEVIIPAHSQFLPLYISNTIFSVIAKCTQNELNNFTYRCDLHNFTQKHKLNDHQSAEFPYPTIHTARKTRFANFKQNIYEHYNIIVPFSTYYIPYIVTQHNVTQSVGYIPFKTEQEANHYLQVITQKHFKLLVHITRYGNFNNIMLLKHLAFNHSPTFTTAEKKLIEKLTAKIGY